MDVRVGMAGLGFGSFIEFFISFLIGPLHSSVLLPNVILSYSDRRRYAKLYNVLFNIWPDQGRIVGTCRNMPRRTVTPLALVVEKGESFFFQV